MIGELALARRHRLTHSLDQRIGIQHAAEIVDRERIDIEHEIGGVRPRERGIDPIGGSTAHDDRRRQTGRGEAHDEGDQQ